MTDVHVNGSNLRMVRRFGSSTIRVAWRFGRLLADEAPRILGVSCCFPRIPAFAN